MLLSTYPLNLCTLPGTLSGFAGVILPILANVDKGRLDFRCHTAGPSVGGGRNSSRLGHRLRGRRAGLAGGQTLLRCELRLLCPAAGTVPGGRLATNSACPLTALIHQTPARARLPSSYTVQGALDGVTRGVKKSLELHSQGKVL